MIQMPLVYNKTEQAYSRVIHPTSLSVFQSLNPLSTATMELPEYENVELLDTVLITTPDDNRDVYRVSSIATDAETNSKSVYLEQCACFLGDYVIPETDTESKKKGTVTALLTEFLSHQDKWSVGTVAATDTLYVESGGMTVLDAINDMMTQIPAYQAVFVGGEDNWHVDIVLRSTTPVCEARLSRNISNCEISVTSQGLCTRVVSSGLTGGKMDSTNIEEMGVHAENMILSDSLSNAQKISIVSAYLASHSVPRMSVLIDGVELTRITGLYIDRFEVGTVCRLTLPWLNLVVNEVIVDKRYDDIINNPESVSFSLANAVPDLTIMVAQARRGGAIAKKAEEKVEADHKRYETKFEQTDQYFRLLATDSEWEQMGDNWEQHITAYSQIVQTAANIQSVVTQTGATATVFDPDATYHTGDRVTHEGTTYRFTADHHGAWTGADVVPVQSMYSQIDQTAESITTIVGQTGVTTGAFNPNTSYAKGDRVLYNGQVYEFTAAHSGAWTGTDVKPIASLQSQITQNAGDIAVRVTENQVDTKLSGYLTVSAHETAIGNVWVSQDNKIVTAASIATAIDTTSGSSKVTLSADHIALYGTTTIGDKFEVVESGNLYIKGAVSIGSSGHYVTINSGNGKLTADHLQVRYGGSLKFSGETDESYAELTFSDVSGMITGASVANNVLTITKKNGGTINFSKATTLSGAWGGTSGNILTVSATQTNKNTSTGQNETTTVGSVVVGTWDYDSDEDKYSRSVQIKNGNTVSQTEYLELPSFTASWANGGQSVPHHAIYTVSSSSPSGTLFETEGYIVANSAWKLDGSGKNTWKKDIYWRVGSTDYATLEFDASGAYNQGVIDAQGQISPITYYQQVTVSPSDIVLDTVNGYSNGNLNVDIEATTATNSLPTSDPNYYSDSTTQQINIPVSTEVVNAAQDTHSAPGSATWVRVNLMSGSQFLYRVTGLGLEFPTNDPSNPSVQGITFDTSTGKYRVVAAAYNSDSGTKTYYSQVNREFVANAAIRHGMQQVVWANPSWNDNTLTVGTSGRLNASGTADNLTKTVTLSGGWHYGTHGQSTEPSAATANAYYSVTSSIDSGTVYERFFTQLSGSVSVVTSQSVPTGFLWIGNASHPNAHQYSYRLAGSVTDSDDNEIISVANPTGSDPLYLVPTEAIRYGTSLVSNGTPLWIGADGGTNAFTYKLTTSGRVNSSGNANEDIDYFSPSEAIGYGFNTCRNSISLSASTQTLGYGSSLTIYPKAKSSIDASSATNITSQGITITAPANNGGISSLTFTSGDQSDYNDWTADAVTVASDGYYLVTATPNSGSNVLKKFHVPAAEAVTVGILPKSNQTLSPGQSVTVHALKNGVSQVNITVTASSVSVGKPYLNQPAQGKIRAIVVVNNKTYYGDTHNLSEYS